MFYSAVVQTQCERGFYEDLSQTCQRCLLGAECEERGMTLQTLQISPDWWRTSETSDDIRQCPLLHACRGSKNFTSDLCNEGYRGPLCSTCEIKWFFSWDDGRCMKCEDTGAHVGTIVTMVSNG